MSLLEFRTDEGIINLTLRPDSAPITVEHVKKLVSIGVYDGTTFYRSDFVIQCGLWGSSKVNPHPPLQVNESRKNNASALSNVRGTVAVAHHDTPDCGNSEIFITLQDSVHLDTAYGGYAVWAVVDSHDVESWKTIDRIASAVLAGKKPVIHSATLK